jgi:hypothetical protein
MAERLGSFSEHFIELGDSTSRVLYQRVHERTERPRVENIVRHKTVKFSSMWPLLTSPQWKARQWRFVHGQKELKIHRVKREVGQGEWK